MSDDTSAGKTPARPTQTHAVSTPDAAQAATPGVSYGFLVTYLVALSALGSFVNDMYTPALPRMVRFFHSTVPVVELGVTFGMIGLALGQLIMGPISDKYGRKPVLIVSMLLFITAAVVSIFSPSIHFFIGYRLVQGMGASGAYFLARTVPADLYGGRMLAKTMALIGAINGFAPASAPVLGGIISASWGWQGVFWVLAGFAAIILSFAWRLKESLPTERRVQGSLWSSFANYGRLVRDYPFMVHVLLKGSALGVLFAYVSASPFIIQTHYGFTEVQYGLIIGANALLCAAGSMAALRFHPFKKGAVVGAMLLELSLTAQAVALYSDAHFWVLEMLQLPMLFALGMIFAVSNTLAMNEGRADAGGASAILGISAYVFGAVVSAMVGIDNVMHSTAIVYLAMGGIVSVFAILSKHIAPDLITKQ